MVWMRNHFTHYGSERGVQAFALRSGIRSWRLRMYTGSRGDGRIDESLDAGEAFPPCAV